LFHISLLFLSFFIFSSFLSAFLVVVYLIVILIHVHFPSLMLAPAADPSDSNPPAGEAEDTEDADEVDFKFDIREAEEALVASEDQEQDLPILNSEMR
jgi:hypothetical protein